MEKNADVMHQISEGFTAPSNIDPTLLGAICLLLLAGLVWGTIADHH